MKNAQGGDARGWQMARWNPFARSSYRRRFRRAFSDDNLYYGVYGSYAAAQADAESLASTDLPASYDVQLAGRLYRAQLDKIRVSDYPLLFWLQQALHDGVRNVFDLGGNIGVTYYGFARYIHYPPDLRWTVHDLPHAMAAGKQWAQAHDERKQLRFSADDNEADGQDLLVCTGALQYLPYTLPELIDRMSRPPPNVLLNLTPMREQQEFFTLQNLGVAITPYRVTAALPLIDAMQARDYDLVDRWISLERNLQVPFHPDARVDGYSGFYFRRR